MIKFNREQGAGGMAAKKWAYEDFVEGATFSLGTKAVTAEEVQSAARKYFVDDGLTVAIMQPVSSSSLPATAEGAL